MDRARMLRVIRLAIVREQASKFGIVGSGELANRVLEAVETEEIEEFERQMIKDAETVVGEPF